MTIHASARERTAQAVAGHVGMAVVTNANRLRLFQARSFTQPTPPRGGTAPKEVPA